MAGGVSKGRLFPDMLLDRVLGSLGYACVFIRDRHLISGAGGIAQLGETAVQTTQALRRELDARGCDHPLVIGFSGAGFGAQQYGIRLGAERIVVFSGGTVGLSSDMAALDDKRARGLINAVDRLDPVDNFVTPVRDLLAKTASPPPITMVFGEKNTGDRRQAEDIAGFKNVTLAPVMASRDHSTFWTWLAKHGPTALLPGAQPEEHNA